MSISPSAPRVEGHIDPTPEAIEQTLRTLWRQIEDAQAAVTQVRMLNLLVYLPEPASPDIDAAINAVAIQHPGRTIIVLHDDGPPRVEATIVCRLGEGRQRACGEQITLHGSVNGHPLHSLAIGLVEAGLPVTVWWHGPLEFDGHMFQQLARVADRVVVDSRTWPNPVPLLAELARTAERCQPRLHFDDLHWAALSFWRRVVARAFDMPAARAALSGLSELTIEHGTAPSSRAGALLLLSWFLERLRWEPSDDPPNRNGTDRELRARRTSAPGSELRIILRQRDTPADITRVELIAEGRQPVRTLFELNLDDRTILTRTQVAPGRPAAQTSRLPHLSVVDLLNEELARPGGDSEWTGVLRMVGRLAAVVDVH